ncbi:PLP-dependent aminotransferase family protein [Comamonas sp. GB3 AK4-5]|uniref:aminotransferase-like domain-containing protein n=1 Tax=Comamonas sp. GB3 AK4-5 TaxID=3231487 RepID=UPI00351F279A
MSIPRPQRTTRYQALVDHMAAAIRNGQLPAGSRLPTHRQLAAREGLALVTASRVYAELAAMGLVSGETGRGSFVKETALPPGHGIDIPPAPAGSMDLSFNMPTLPGQAELLRTALRQLALTGDLDALLRYQPHGGRPRDRAAVAQHLQARGLQVASEQVVLVDGAQHGLTVALMARLAPGDVVAVDALSYPGFKLLAQQLHLKLLPIPSTPQGPDMAALQQLCKKRSVRAVYAQPTLHNPLGWVLPLSQRQQLVEIARSHDLTLIEDAAYAYLADPAPPPLATLAPERTLYVSGLSKSVATGLRVGWVVAPPAWVPALESAIRATTWNTAGVMTAMACGWLEDGTVAQLEADKRADARQRQQLAARVLGTLLPELPRMSHPSSYFLWLPLPPEVRADQVAQALLQQQIAVSTAEPFATTAQAPHALRLALASLPLPLLEQALQQVGQTVLDFSA